MHILHTCMVLSSQEDSIQIHIKVPCSQNYTKAVLSRPSECHLSTQHVPPPTPPPIPHSISASVCLSVSLSLHAPIQQKRIKVTKPCPWLTPELICKMTKRDQLKCNWQFDEYIQKRNYVSSQAEKVKKNDFSELVKDKCGMSFVRTAIYFFFITHKYPKNCDKSAGKIRL